MSGIVPREGASKWSSVKRLASVLAENGSVPSAAH